MQDTSTQREQVNLEVRGAERAVRDTGCRMRDTGCGMQGTGYRMRDTSTQRQQVNCLGIRGTGCEVRIALVIGHSLFDILLLSAESANRQLLIAKR